MCATEYCSYRTGYKSLWCHVLYWLTLSFRLCIHGYRFAGVCIDLVTWLHYSIYPAET